MRFVVFSLILVLNVLSTRSIDILNGACLTDTNCGTTEYCDHDFPNPIGRCKTGYEPGENCFRDKHCASKRCHLFKCEKRLQMKDGPCKINEDCPETQYCSRLPNTDDLHMCTDRKNIGACLKNSQCISDKCHLFTCVKSED